MTRINCVPVQELCNKHLFAEWREMPRLVGNLDKSLNRKSKPFSLSEIPANYKLGSGHVKFFYNKFEYLHKRHIQLTNELIKRGYNLSTLDSSNFTNVPKNFYKTWEPSIIDLELNRQRIKDRLPNKPKYN